MFPDKQNSNLRELKNKLYTALSIALASVLLSLTLYSMTRFEPVYAQSSTDKPYPQCLDSSIPITDIERLNTEGIFLTDDTCLTKFKSVTQTTSINLNPQPFQSPVYKYAFYNTDGSSDVNFEPLGYKTLPISLTNGGWVVASLFTHLNVRNSDVISFSNTPPTDHGQFISYQAPLGNLEMVGEIQHAKALTQTLLVNFVLFVNGLRVDEFVKVDPGVAIRFSIHSTMTYGLNIFGDSTLVGLIERNKYSTKLKDGELVGNQPPNWTIFLPLLARQP